MSTSLVTIGKDRMHRTFMYDESLDKSKPWCCMFNRKTTMLEPVLLSTSTNTSCVPVNMTLQQAYFYTDNTTKQIKKLALAFTNTKTEYYLYLIGDSLEEILHHARKYTLNDQPFHHEIERHLLAVL